VEASGLGQMLHKFLGSAEMFGDERLAAEARTLETSLEERSRPPIEILRTAAEAIRKAA
jgi:HPt (histidine-containing phosphotransfer) domain-containing protein